MNFQPQNPYIGYEYKEISVAGKDAALFLDSYQNFGWIPDGDCPDRGSKGTATLHFKRNRKLINRTELTRLQRNFEGCMAEIRRLESAPRRTARLWALLVSLLGTAFLAGAVFAVTGEPPRYLVMGVLAVPGFAGWIAPPFLYRYQLKKQNRKVRPFLDAQYEEIDRLCEKGHSLL